MGFIVRVDDLLPGSVLADNVVDDQGNTLFRSGQKIGLNEIKALKAWGIMEINILETKLDKELGELENSERFKIVKNEMETLFKHTDQEHPAVKELFKFCIKRKLKMSEKEG